MPNIQGATGEVTIGGEVYIMSPICDKDIEELNIWLRSKVITAARASLPANAPEALEDRVLMQAMRVASKLDWMNNPDTMASPENLLRMLWQLMRKCQPDLLSEDFTRELIGDPDALVRCRDMFRLLHPLLAGDEEMPAENPPKGKGTTGTGSTQKGSAKPKRKRKKQKRRDSRSTRR